MAEEEGLYYQSVYILLPFFFLISSSFFATDSWELREGTTFLSLPFADYIAKKNL